MGSNLIVNFAPPHEGMPCIALSSFTKYLNVLDFYASGLKGLMQGASVSIICQSVRLSVYLSVIPSHLHKVQYVKSRW